MPKFDYVGQFTDGGSLNGFYKLKGRKYGFKSFPNQSLADFSHAVQKDLSSSDLAPRVYSPVCKIRVPNYFAESNGRGGIRTVTHMVLSNWGYLTEIASPYISDDGMCEYDDEVNDLLEMLYKYYGIDYSDSHEGNFGYVKRLGKKKLVVIDLGAEGISIDDEDERYPKVCWDGAEDYSCYCTNCVERYSYV
jgi:hypothetical protein